MITYKNGNYKVILKEDGTKIHILPDTETEFKPDRVETLDICVNTYCENNCDFCYENCSKDGKFADLKSERVIEFINTIPYGTELALNINSYKTQHIFDMFQFLRMVKDRGLIANITIRQNDFMNERMKNTIRMWVKDGLVHGIGISLINPDDGFLEEINKSYWNNNIVVHTIFGITKCEDYLKLKDCKVLILGFKSIGRGKDFKIDTKIKKDVYDNLEKISNIVNVLSFDNLAIKQLSPKRFVSNENWERSYMGNEGTISMFVDLVNMTYAQSSLVSKEKRKSMIITVDEMYNNVKGE